MNKKEFDYANLRGKVVSIFGTFDKFATAMKLSKNSISKKINNKVPFTQDEIHLAANLLGVQGLIELYFFTTKVEEK